MRFKGILLDIDNTLYDYEQAHRAGLAAALAVLAKRLRMGLPRLRKAYLKGRGIVNRSLRGTAASHNRMLYFQRMLEILGVNPLRHALPAYSAYWRAFLAEVRVSKDVRWFLKRTRGTRVCLVTDLTAHIQHRKIARLGLARYAAGIVTSEEAGHEKPHPAIFRLAIKKLGLRPRDVCMIGDNYAKDILGATRVGIRAFWLNPEGGRKRLGPLASSVRNLRELGEEFR